MTMPSTISGKLREIFGRDRNSITIAHSDDRGQTRNIQFNLKEGEQGGEDFVTFTSIAESDREWIAVARDSSKKLYDFCERSTFFEGDSLKDMNHPLTRALITTDMIFEGSELLTLLTDFSRRRD